MHHLGPRWLEIVQFSALVLLAWVLPSTVKYYRRFRSLWARYMFHRGHERMKKGLGMGKTPRWRRVLAHILMAWKPPLD